MYRHESRLIGAGPQPSGPSPQKNEPVKVEDLTDVKSVSAGPASSLASK